MVVGQGAAVAAAASRLQAQQLQRQLQLQQQQQQQLQVEQQPAIEAAEEEGVKDLVPDSLSHTGSGSALPPPPSTPLPPASTAVETEEDGERVLMEGLRVLELRVGGAMNPLPLPPTSATTAAAEAIEGVKASLSDATSTMTEEAGVLGGSAITTTTSAPTLTAPEALKNLMPAMVGGAAVIGTMATQAPPPATDMTSREAIVTLPAAPAMEAMEAPVTNAIETIQSSLPPSADMDEVVSETMALPPFRPRSASGHALFPPRSLSQTAQEGELLPTSIQKTERNGVETPEATAEMTDTLGGAAPLASRPSLKVSFTDPPGVDISTGAGIPGDEDLCGGGFETSSHGPSPSPPPLLPPSPSQHNSMAQAMAAAMAAVQSLPSSSANGPFSPNSAAFSNMAAAAAAAAAAAVASMNGSGRHRGSISMISHFP